MDNQALISYINVYHSQLDIIYVDKFWCSINNKQWIYADDILIEWIGYKKDNGKFKYTNLIRENFKENEDYKTYNYEEINKVFHSPLKENENNITSYYFFLQEKGCIPLEPEFACLAH